MEKIYKIYIKDKNQFIKKVQKIYLILFLFYFLYLEGKTNQMYVTGSKNDERTYERSANSTSELSFLDVTNCTIFSASYSWHTSIQISQLSGSTYFSKNTFSIMKQYN